ncbi:MAG: MogA/MoaB family molybdenum cofactor biosynthesis protein [Candidatus Omnitrophica bacterium]|nr:MogA/MoaB family molybdenum cofactor biosynthesis protein [Candidatus Omnitrophota bacterium]
MRQAGLPADGLVAGIVTVSDSRSLGKRADTATGLIQKILEKAGFAVAQTALIPDERRRIEKCLIDFSDRLKLALVVTTGGTGLGPRDVTPEATWAVVNRPIPGLPEAMRVETARRNPKAWLSRAAAGQRGKTLIVNLPGSPRGVRECLKVLLPLLPHALQMVEGKSHDGQ